MTFLVVGDTARNPGRSGIQTVVRSLAAAFGEQRAPVRPVVWIARPRLLRPLPPELSVGPGAEPLRDLAGAAGLALRRQPAAWFWWLRAGGNIRRMPLHRHPLHRRAPPGSWVLLPELMYKGKTGALIDYVHRRGWRLAVIFYDTIPVDRPDLVPPDLPAKHARYMRELAGADLILPISEASAEGLARLRGAGKAAKPRRCGPVRWRAISSARRACASSRRRSRPGNPCACSACPPWSRARTTRRCWPPTSRPPPADPTCAWNSTSSARPTPARRTSWTRCAPPRPGGPACAGTSRWNIPGSRNFTRGAILPSTPPCWRASACR